MKRKFSNRYALLICAFSLSATPVFGETLLQIYEQATTNDHQFQAARANLDAGRENRTIGRSRLLPQVTAEASWLRSDSSNRLPGADTGAADPSVPVDSLPLDLRYGEQTSKSATVNVNQALFDWGAWQGYQRGKALASEAEAVFATAEEDLILRTADAYFSVLQAVDNLATAQSEEEALSQQLQQSRQRFEVGLIAITEVHEAQAAYDSATARRLVADGNVRISFEALEALTGGSPGAVAPLQKEFPVTPPDPTDRDTWVEQALANNSQLQAARFRAESAESLAATQRSGHYPTVYGRVSHGITETDFHNSAGTSLRDEDSTVVSVTLSVPLFAGGGVSASRRQAYSQYLSAQELYQQSRRDVVQSTRSSYQAVVTSVATVKARAQAIVSSRSALEATQAGYDVGTRDLVDVLNAQRNLFSAERDYNDALYTYLLAQLQLRAAAGVLSSEDVVQLNQWLDPEREVRFARN